MAGTGRKKPGGHEGHATGGMRDQIKEGGESSHQPEHGIRPSAWAVHGILAIASQKSGEMARNVERVGPDRINKKHQALVAKIRQGHGVSPRSASHAPPLIHAIPEGGRQ